MSQTSMLLREFRDGIGWMCTDGDDFILANGIWAVRLPYYHEFFSRIPRGLLPKLPVQGEEHCVLVGDPANSSGKSPASDDIRAFFATAKDAIGLELTPIMSSGPVHLRLLIAGDDTPVWVDDRWLRLIGCLGDHSADEMHLLRYRPESRHVLWATASGITGIVMPCEVDDPIAKAVGEAAASIVNHGVKV
jgi:hypothetical protein